MQPDKKDMSKLHNLPKFSQVVKDKNAVLVNRANNGRVDMKWGWNDEVSLDQIIAIKVPVGEREYNQGHVEVFIDWQEIYHYARGVSLSMKEAQQRIDEIERDLRR
jgi:hypothetical protein